jgi:hypothetical protein
MHRGGGAHVLLSHCGLCPRPLAHPSDRSLRRKDEELFD